MVLHLNKLESPTPKDALWQVWLKLVQWFLRRRFLNLSMYFCYFIIFCPSFEQTWNPSPKDALCQVWLVLLKKMKMWKVYDNTNDTNDANHDGQILIGKPHLRWAKNHCNAYCNTFLNIAIYRDRKHYIWFTRPVTWVCTILFRTKYY